MCFALTGKMHSMGSAEGYTEVRLSNFGKGLFVVKDIPPHTHICFIKGKHLSFKETLLLGERESHCIQIGSNDYILCKSPFLYTNHSCNPNCGINSNLELISIKTICAGEELFWDYSTSMLERHWTMKCKCGSENCRKIIQDFDLLPSALQEKYIKLNIVLPFILEELRYKIAI